MKTRKRPALPAGRLSKDERKEQLLATIERMAVANGYAPTRREVATAMNVSLARVAQLTEDCVADGTLTRHPKAARAVRVTRATAGGGGG